MIFGCIGRFHVKVVPPRATTGGLDPAPLRRLAVRPLRSINLTFFQKRYSLWRDGCVSVIILPLSKRVRNTKPDKAKLSPRG